MTFPERRYFPKEEFIAPSLEENRSFLEEGNGDDSLRLWNSTSRYPKLLSAKSEDNLKNLAIAAIIAYFIFREEEGVFQYGYYNVATGKKRLLKDAARIGVLRMSRASELQARTIGMKLINGTISVREWHSMMSALLRQEYRAAYLASSGGIENYGFFEAQVFSGMAGFYLERLGNLAERLARGELPLNGHVVGWSGMYARAGNSIFWNASLKRAQRNGMREARRILGPNENHCLDSGDRPGCFELAEQGWAPIDQMVELGDATCLSNCLCSMQYRR